MPAEPRRIPTAADTPGNWSWPGTRWQTRSKVSGSSSRLTAQFRHSQARHDRVIDEELVRSEKLVREADERISGYVKATISGPHVTLPSGAASGGGGGSWSAGALRRGFRGVAGLLQQRHRRRECSCVMAGYSPA